MDREFWLERWSEGRIGFHEGRPNEFLSKHVGRLGRARRVLMPLCGKAQDIVYLAQQGHHVVGVELAEQAIRDFFAENQLTPRIHDRGSFKEYESQNIRLLVGDFFDATPELVGPLDVFYDRAALIALPSGLRRRYVPHVLSLVGAKGEGLVITLEYDPAQMNGPPFSLSDEEVHALYESCRLTLIDEAPGSGSPRFQALGLPARERCYLVQR